MACRGRCKRLRQAKACATGGQATRTTLPASLLTSSYFKRRADVNARAVIAWIAYKIPEELSEIPGISVLDVLLTNAM